MVNFLEDFETKLGIKISRSQKMEPLGTAGSLALAQEKLLDGGEASIMGTKVILLASRSLLLCFKSCYLIM